MKIQTIQSDQSHPTSHWNRAGPKLLAGFTDVPVSHSHNKWTNVKARPITIHATDQFSLFDVAQSTANTNTNVNTISANNHNKILQFTQSNPFAHSAEKLHPNIIASNTAQIIHPTNWAKTYCQNSFVFIHHVIQTHKLTAGFTWHPETGQIA